MVEERFWKKVKKTSSCWLWTAGKFPDGYGVFQLDGAQRAHRVAYMLEHGHYPENLCLHHCDNRLCVNPEHLYDGTYSDNAVDREMRGRGKKNRGRAKLNFELAEEIREKYATGTTSQRKLAAEYGVAQVTIHEVVNGITWKEEL